MESFLHDLKTLMFQNRKIAVIGCHSWASAAQKTMIEYVEKRFKNCEVLGTPLDIKSSLKDEEEGILDSMAKTIAKDIAESPEPDSLV